MTKMLATILVCAIIIVPAGAQTLSAAPDVGAYQARAATYAAGTTANVLGDGSNAAGGVAPAFSTHPEPIEDESGLNSGWIVTGGASFETVGNASNSPREKKWRTHANSSHFNFDDAIRLWGQPGKAHCHEYFGNEQVAAYTTRASLRTRTKSTAAGGDFQSTGYWEPCTTKVIGGRTYAIPAKLNTIYYSEDQAVGVPIVNDMQRLHLLFRFIGGVNMDDPSDAGVKAEIAAANAQPGTSGRYSYIGNGFAGYGCLAPGSSSPVATKVGAGSDTNHSYGFTMADGSDPWEGRCGAGATIYAENSAPSCWDGVNVSSPNGYDHVRRVVRDNSTGQPVCPNGWYKVPAFQVKSEHMTQGFADYSTWKLSSDPMMAVKLGRSVLPGASGHFDWMNGQAKSILDRWLSFCMGIGAAPHTCNNSTIDANGVLVITNAPDGSRKPQVNFALTINSNDPAQLHLIDTTRATHVNMRGM